MVIELGYEYRVFEIKRKKTETETNDLFYS